MVTSCELCKTAPWKWGDILRNQKPFLLFHRAHVAAPPSRRIRKIGRPLCSTNLKHGVRMRWRQNRMKTKKWTSKISLQNGSDFKISATSREVNWPPFFSGLHCFASVFLPGTKLTKCTFAYLFVLNARSFANLYDIKIQEMCTTQQNT